MGDCYRLQSTHEEHVGRNTDIGMQIYAIYEKVKKLPGDIQITFELKDHYGKPFCTTTMTIAEIKMLKES